MQIFKKETNASCSLEYVIGYGVRIWDVEETKHLATMGESLTVTPYGGRT